MTKVEVQFSWKRIDYLMMLIQLARQPKKKKMVQFLSNLKARAKNITVKFLHKN